MLRRAKQAGLGEFNTRPKHILEFDACEAGSYEALLLRWKLQESERKFTTAIIGCLLSKEVSGKQISERILAAES